MTHHIRVSSLSACILFAIFAMPAIAHETGAPHGHASLEAEARIDVSNPLPAQKPLDLIKARAQQIKQNAQGARIELRQETKAQLQGADSPGEKRDIIRNFVGERVDIAKQRFASTTRMKRDIKAAIRWHGGLVRERFAVAIRQLDRIVERMESRIEKLAAAGVATASVEAELDIAVGAIATAKADAQAVADFVASVQDVSDRAAVKAELEAKIRTAHTSLKSAHQALKSVARSLVTLHRTNVKADVDASASVKAEVE